LSDLEEVFIKEINMAFVKLYRVISILGVGAFGVVLEVENQVTREISALKVCCHTSFLLHINVIL